MFLRCSKKLSGVPLYEIWKLHTFLSKHELLLKQTDTKIRVCFFIYIDIGIDYLHLTTRVYTKGMFCICMQENIVFMCRYFFK